MKHGELSDYFVGIGTKLLQGTEVDPRVSNGHEFQGVSEFRAFLGTEGRKVTIPMRYVWLSDDIEQPITLLLQGTWYDSRRGQSHRGPEYRLYYPAASEEVVHRARAGDRLFLCQPKSGALLAVLCPSGSTVEQQLLWLFGLARGENFELDLVDLRVASGRPLDIAARLVLELIDVEIETTDERWLKRMLAKFGATFPSTSKFSQFTRQLAVDVDPLQDPDGALLHWMDLEERLFLTLERHIVGERLKNGFIVNGKPDVDGFVQYSLSVQNRRKSRAGWAFANHINAILDAHGVQYCREATTEKRNGPDFLFPSEQKYHDLNFPASHLVMLGVKTSCKDRWRQVLAEANRIEHKHLLTLEPGISVAQTSEMERANLHLVVPQALHESYQPIQRSSLWTVKQFLEHIKSLAVRST